MSMTTKTKTKATPKKPLTHKQRGLKALWVKVSLQNKFKSRCAAEGSSMSEVIDQLLTNYVNAK